MRQNRIGFVCIFLLALTVGQASAQTLGQAPSDAVSFWRVTGALLLCIALGIAAIFVLRSRSGATLARPSLPSFVRKDRRLQLIEILRLNQHVDLCLVACDGKPMLLAASSHGVEVLPLDAVQNVDGVGGSGTDT